MAVGSTHGTSRRTFLRTSAAGVGAATLVAVLWVLADDRVKGANERPGIGFIGTGGRGRLQRSG